MNLVCCVCVDVVSSSFTVKFGIDNGSVDVLGISCAMNVTVSVSLDIVFVCSVSACALNVLDGSGLVSVIRAPVAILFVDAKEGR